MAARALAATSSGLRAFRHFELIEASDLTAIARRAKGDHHQPPGGA
jgi:hypothetical protein